MGHLTGKDIVAIIQAGAKSGVYTLELGTFKVKYGKAIDHPEPEQLPLFKDTPQTQPTPPENSFSSEIDQALLSVTDPVAYEELVLGVKHHVET